MANILTGLRILCGMAILRFPTFSGWFFTLYLLGGFTDAIDGTVARKLGEASAFGSKFDTAADFIFTISVGIKLIRTLYVPLWLTVWTALIGLIKIGSHLAGYLMYHELRPVHSLLNKLCGGYIFLLPLFIGGRYAWQAKALLVLAGCMLATAAALAESREILKSKGNPEQETV